MLIFGASVGDWREKADYAQDKADNEFAEIREVRCEGIEDVQTAFAFMAALAADTKCEQFLYHATINLYRGERLTREQWMQAVDLLEKNLNLTGHYRVIFEHIKNNRQHYHIIWSRLPPGNDGPAVNMGFDYNAHRNTAVALEKEFGLKPAPRRDRGKPSRKKEETNERNGKVRVDPDTVTNDVTKIYHASKTSKDFVKNLSKDGYTITRGRGNRLVLVDKKGGWHGLMRRIDGVRTADVRRKFPDLENMALPALDEVLRNRRPPSTQSFRKAAVKSVGRSRASYRPRSKPARVGHNPYLKTPRMRSVASVMAEARARNRAQEEKKYYPAPIMRKRRRKKEDENKLAKGGPTQAEIDNAELLRWAWENHRVDILAQFGIHVLPENPTLQDLVQHGIIPPDALEP